MVPYKSVFFFTLEITEINCKSCLLVVLRLHDLQLFPVISIVQKENRHNLRFLNLQHNWVPFQKGPSKYSTFYSKISSASSRCVEIPSTPSFELNCGVDNCFFSALRIVTRTISKLVLDTSTPCNEQWAQLWYWGRCGDAVVSVLQAVYFTICKNMRRMIFSNVWFCRIYMYEKIKKRVTE